MAYEEITSINASLGLGEVISYVNNVTDQWFGNMILIGIWIIVLLGYFKATGDFWSASAISGFTLFVVGLLFWLGGFIGNVAFTMVLGLAVLSVIPLFMRPNN